MRFIAVFLLSIIFSTPTFASQADTLYVQLKNKNKKTNKSLDVLSLQIKQAQADISLDEKGNAIITGLKAGKYTLLIEGQGFRTQTKKIEKKHFQSNDTLVVEVVPIWVIEGSESLTFSQNAVGRYWQAGGLTSIATRASLTLGAEYKKGRRNWETEFGVDYGVVKNGGFEWIKNEDQVKLDS